MADIDAARLVLRGLRREVEESAPGQFTVSRDQVFSVGSAEIDAYLLHKPQLQKSTETQLFFPGHYEHVIQFEGDGFRRRLRRDEDLSLRNPDGVVIEISSPSALFSLSLTDADRLDQNLRRFMMPPIRRSQEAARPLGDIFRISTIKVTADPATQLGRSSQKMHDLAEAALFHFAYGYGYSISFTNSWERTYYWLGRREREAVQFPLRTYNSELVSYYALALASDSLVLGFLALYKILEYFYTSVSENALHQRMRELLVAPDFVPTKAKKLRDLVKAVRSFDNRLDELAALKLVLSTYFGAAELRRWIEEYEITNGTYYTTETMLFGTTTKIDLNENALISNLASRIYLIRNALVHNKEGEISRFIPYTGQEDSLQKEVQILLFLAEQLIIKTGKDIG